MVAGDLPANVLQHFMIAVRKTNHFSNTPDASLNFIIFSLCVCLVLLSDLLHSQSELAVWAMGWGGELCV